MGKTPWLRTVLYVVAVVVLLAIIFVRTGSDQREHRGSFLEFYGIFTTVEPTDLELYRELVPEPLAVPDEPRVAFIVLNYNHVRPWPFTPYLEGVVAVACSYQGEQGWHVLTMPVTKRVSRLGGRAIGFPKYLPDGLSLRSTEKGWEGAVEHEGQVRLRLEFTPGLSRELTPFEQAQLDANASRLADPVFQLVPPDEGPALNRVIFIQRVPPTWTVEQGMVRISIGDQEPWAGLVPPGTVAAGVLQKFNGGADLVPRRLN
jgi:hypothetical protein